MQNIREMSNEPVNREFVKYYVSIDSSHRNRSLYPNNNDYVVSLGERYHGIYSIRLIEAVIPNSEYIINDNNNKIDFTYSSTDSSTDYTATLTNGNYTPTSSTDLEANIKTAMNAAVGGVISSITYSDLTRKLTFNTGGNVTFNFKTGNNAVNNAAELLGFNPYENKTISSGNTSDNVINVNGPNYIILNIDADDDELNALSNEHGSGPTQGLSSSSATDNIYASQVFGKLPLDVTQGNNIHFKDEYPIEYIFKRGLKASLNKFKISFYKKYGDNSQKFNFNGQEHQLTFEIQCCLDKKKALEYNF